MRSPAARVRRRLQVSHSPWVHCGLRQSNSHNAISSGTSPTTWPLAQSHSRTNAFWGRAPFAMRTAGRRICCSIHRVAQFLSGSARKAVPVRPERADADTEALAPVIPFGRRLE